MRHKTESVVMAVKRIRATLNTQEQKRMLMDLDVSMRTVDCVYTVSFCDSYFFDCLFFEAGCYVLLI